jgi:FAD:protein FMN transferase
MKRMIASIFCSLCRSGFDGRLGFRFLRKGHFVPYLRTVPVLLLVGCAPVHKSSYLVMGTYLEVTSDDPRAGAIVRDEFRRVEKLMSAYDPESDVGRLNRNGRAEVRPDPLQVMAAAQEVWRQSHGAFDVTVGPLLDLWGFTDKQFREPSAAQVASAKRLVGMDKIIVHPQESVIELTVPGMRIDLGGIAKGYALDTSVRLLSQAGIRNCLINAGGQVYALGYKHRRPWVIALRHPRDPKRAYPAQQLMPGNSFSTSGDYEQYFTAQGRRFSHILDPRTGSPAQAGIMSVTVSSPSAMYADALSTAIFVLGEKEGRALAARCNVQIVSLIRSDDE